MDIFYVLTSNYIINVGVVACFLAQILKVPFTLLLTRRFMPERLIGAGGMPSSHSSFTCAIAIAMARKQGFASPEFALALAFAAIVMHDAMGVRRAAGEQAKVLNKMIFDFPFFSLQKTADEEEPESSGQQELPDRVAYDEQEDDGEHLPLISKELKEFLGHTPIEVLGGFLLGVLVAVIMPVR